MSHGGSGTPGRGPPYAPPRQPSYGSIHVPTGQPVARKPVRAFRLDTIAPLFAGDWSVNNCIALGSFKEEPRNSIMVAEAAIQTPQPHFRSICEVPVTMPQTKIAWEASGSSRMLSSGDTLRLWQFNGARLDPLASYAKRSKSQPHVVPAPLTSFDWNAINQNMVITSSIDTTCTLWDLASQTVTTQLIAHDQEVNDVAFLTSGQNQFVSVGADGSVRLFDLRSLDNSTIIYEAPIDERTRGIVPMLRVAPSPMDQNILCAFGQEQDFAVVLDIRATRNPITKLRGHSAPINSVRWIPQSSNLVATGGDDCQLLVWDVSRATFAGAHNEHRPVNNVLASKDGVWLGAVSGHSVQGISAQIL